MYKKRKKGYFSFYTIHVHSIISHRELQFPYVEINYPYFGMVAPVENPHLCRSLARSQLPHLRPLTCPLYPLPANTCTTTVQLYSDDINNLMSSSVGHSNNNIQETLTSPNLLLSGTPTYSHVTTSTWPFIHMQTDLYLCGHESTCTWLCIHVQSCFHCALWAIGPSFLVHSGPLRIIIDHTAESRTNFVLFLTLLTSFKALVRRRIAHVYINSTIQG
jgi:hypothetical protein